MAGSSVLVCLSNEYNIQCLTFVMNSQRHHARLFRLKSASNKVDSSPNTENCGCNKKKQREIIQIRFILHFTLRRTDLVWPAIILQ